LALSVPGAAISARFASWDEAVMTTFTLDGVDLGFPLSGYVPSRAFRARVLADSPELEPIVSG
jgi:hypothetical protein